MNGRPSISRDEAERLVLGVFSARGQPNLDDGTSLADIGYSTQISLLNLLASRNQALVGQYGTRYALNDFVVGGWRTVGDVVISVETVGRAGTFTV